MGYRYDVYGLLVESAQPLKGVLPGSSVSEPDLRIEWRAAGEGPSDLREWTPVMATQLKPTDPVSLAKVNSEKYEVWRIRCDIDNSPCDFIYDLNDKRLNVVYPANIARSRLNSYLLGSVMSSILRLRGTICIHASVVSFNGRAIGMVGRKGAGKSTLSAALAQRGGMVLSDDIAAITHSDNQFWVHPGDMRPRLLKNSVQELFGANHNFRKARAEDDKVRVTINGCARESEVPKMAALSGFWLIETSGNSTGEVTISTLPPGERFMSLSQHLYGFWLDKGQTQASEFRTLGRIVDSIPITRLVRPNSLDGLNDICDAVLADFIPVEAASIRG